MSSDQTPDPSIAVIGAGAIGAVVAECLLEADRHPVVCVRTPVERLVVETAGAGERTLSVRIAASPDEVSPVDWVLVTVKAHETPGVAPWLARLVRAGTVVAVLQNGVGHAERLAPYAAGAFVLPAVVYLAAQRVAPGRVLHHRGQRLIVSRGADGGRFAQLFEGSKMEVDQVDDLTTEMWRKLLSNVIVNPITALTARRTEVMRDPGMDELARGLMAETVAVARAEGAALSEADAEAVVSRFSVLGEGGGATSTYYDRMEGRPMEYEELNGAVVRLGRRHGIETPLHSALVTLLRAVETGQATA